MNRSAGNRPLLAALLGLAAAAGCDPDPTIPATEVDRLSVELSAGECAGYCRRLTEVGADLHGRYRELALREDPTYPPKERSFTLGANEWHALAAVAATATAEPWQPQYGCPDCADQGAWRLTLHTTGGETRTTILDRNEQKNPAALQRVVTSLRALHAESR